MRKARPSSLGLLFEIPVAGCGPRVAVAQSRMTALSRAETLGPLEAGLLHSQRGPEGSRITMGVASVQPTSTLVLSWPG